MEKVLYIPWYLYTVGNSISVDTEAQIHVLGMVPLVVWGSSASAAESAREESQYANALNDERYMIFVQDVLQSTVGNKYWNRESLGRPDMSGVRSTAAF